MKAIVWKITEPKTSKYNDSTNQRIIFKSLDNTDKKSYYLNLDNKYGQKYIEQWSPYLKEGNVLDVNLQDNGKNINLFNGFNVIKEVTDK